MDFYSPKEKILEALILDEFPKSPTRNSLEKSFQETPKRQEKILQARPSSSAQPKIEYVPSDLLPGHNLPNRPSPGEIFCPKKLSGMAIMKCGEYQKAGCSCPIMASPQEIEFIKSKMRFREK